MRLESARSRVALVGGEARDQLVEGALGVEPHRPQLARAPVRPGAARRRAPRSRARGASRGAGSIVTTATRCPRAARASAIAAAIVVLPTPPAPTQMHSRPSSALDALMRADRQRVGEHARAAARRAPGASSSGSCVGARAGARAARAARAPRASSASATASALGAAPPARAARSAQRGGVGVAEAARHRRALTSTASSRVAEVLAQVEQLVDGGLLAASRPPPARSAARSRSVCGDQRALAGDRARPAAAFANVRGASSSARPWPVAGASTITTS